MVRNEKLILLALLVLNGALKLCWLGVNELSGDEPFTVFWAQQKTSDLLAMFRDENNPPLYFFLIKWWSAMAPYEVPWLRVPSALFSTLAVWPLFLLARRHTSLWATVTACLIFTFCNEHYTYAHEVRAYSLLTLLTVAGMWQVDRLARKEPRALLWLVLGNTALVYTHFMGWAAIGIQFLCTLLVPEWRAGHKRWFQAAVVTVVLFLPYGWLFAQRVGSSVAQGTWLTAPAWDEPYSMLWRWSNAPVITVVFIAVVVFGLWRSKVKGTLEKVALLWCGMPLVGLFLLSFVVPLYLDRYLVWAAPGFAVLVAVCLQNVGSAVAARGAMALAGVAMLVTFVPWKSNGMRPSAVVAQCKAWLNDDAGFRIVPYWYVLNYAAAYDPGLFKENLAHETWQRIRTTGIAGDASLTDTNPNEPSPKTVVVIDAARSIHAQDEELRRFLWDHYTAVDSVEADRNVWVYRFRK